MRFAYLYFMANDPTRVANTAPRHVAHWHALALPGYVGGPFTDRTGGLITFSADDRAAAEAAVLADPFVREALVTTWWLKSWEPVPSGQEDRSTSLGSGGHLP